MAWADAIGAMDAGGLSTCVSGDGVGAFRVGTRHGHALFQFSGLVWNTVSVSYRQRHIPDALLGRVNSLYRLMAWGMMPVGLLVSGVIVRVSEMVVSRDIALIMPFLVAFAGAILLGLFGWRALARNWV